MKATIISYIGEYLKISTVTTLGPLDKTEIKCFDKRELSLEISDDAHVITFEDDKKVFTVLYANVNQTTYATWAAFKTAINLMIDAGIGAGGSVIIPDPLLSDEIIEKTTDNGVAIEGVLLKDSKIGLVASGLVTMQAAGTGAATATELVGGSFFNIENGGTGGVALPTDPMNSEEIYIVNASGVSIKVFADVAGSTGLVTTSFTSPVVSFTLADGKICKYKYIQGLWLQHVVI